MNTSSGTSQKNSAAQFGPMSKIRFATAAEVCNQAAVSDQARALLTAQTSFADFLDLLLRHDLTTDAISIVAHALPKREAVWWACLAARAVIDSNTLPEIQAALEAAESWVYKPSEETRRDALRMAQQTRFDHPAAWAAIGAFWSGGSMVAPELPPVPPAEHLTGLAVCGAVQLAAVCREPEQAQKKYRALLDQAVDIANGGNGRAKRAG